MNGIKPKQLYQHHSGRLYHVLHIANTAHPSEKFPPMVIYQGVANGEIWARSVAEFTEPGFVKCQEIYNPLIDKDPTP